MMFRNVAFIIAIAITTPAVADTGDILAGRASVIDGDTIEIQGRRIRLHGIDAPESSQWCENEAAKRYRCGQDAAFFLDDMIAQRPVECTWTTTDRYDRVIGICAVADAERGWVDVNATMVLMGHALAYRQYSRDYISFEERARQSGRGIWRGAFTAPWTWRQQRRN